MLKSQLLADIDRVFPSLASPWTMNKTPSATLVVVPIKSTNRDSQGLRDKEFLSYGSVIVVGDPDLPWARRMNLNPTHADQNAILG